MSSRRLFLSAVKGFPAFPGPEHCYSMKKGEAEKFKKLLQD